MGENKHFYDECRIIYCVVDETKNMDSRRDFDFDCLFIVVGCVCVRVCVAIFDLPFGMVAGRKGG